MRKRVPVLWPLLVLLLAGGTISGCGGDDATGPGPTPEPQPQPGDLRVTVTPTAAALGAMVLHVSGPAISNPTATGRAILYHDLTGGTLKAALVGTSLSGEVLRFAVPDIGDVSDYTVTVHQVAGNDNEPRATGAVAATLELVP